MYRMLPPVFDFVDLFAGIGGFRIAVLRQLVQVDGGGIGDGVQHAGDGSRVPQDDVPFRTPNVAAESPSLGVGPLAVADVPRGLAVLEMHVRGFRRRNADQRFAE